MAKLDLIGIVVADMPKSLAFYRALGMDIPPEMDSEGHVEVTLPGGLRMAWDTIEVIRSFMPDWVASSEGEGIGRAFLCDSGEDVDATYHKLVSMGYASNLAPFTAPWGQRYAQVKDPDRNTVDLFAPMS